MHFVETIPHLEFIELHISFHNLQQFLRKLCLRSILCLGFANHP
jgi:hypothetical protein